ncbi:hypothetical protein BJ138DRAFT_1118141 [Hygrophoropsis aurantiaca]|uniref:Uncharacterized protein n=1 Tax=Hygrophoropsis aurantiaca TaxID=72124 RepID=A0ACB7ZY46_9AGAM|nr:hypothetical protein BJ138DRAFT_1118141 [Hygrophoropsis aurantiaca]
MRAHLLRTHIFVDIPKALPPRKNPTSNTHSNKIMWTAKIYNSHLKLLLPNVKFDDRNLRQLFAFMAAKFLPEVLQTGVALKRVETYLNEEVSDQVSSIKTSSNPADDSPDTDGLAIESGAFKWNEVPEEKKATNNKTVVDSESVAVSESEDHQFELHDISVRFPEGELTVITGPTASGKAALLASIQTVYILSALY